MELFPPQTDVNRHLDLLKPMDDDEGVPYIKCPG